LLDNYDSFTYNLLHYLEGEGVSVDVIMNDEIELKTLHEYDKVVLSPGPGLPSESGSLKEVVKVLKGKVPILGVCLGMQAIAEEMSGRLYNQKLVKHGVSESIQIFNSRIFEGLANRIQVGLYHSWAIDDSGDYSVTALSDSGVVMAIENKENQLYGVQFHPESIMTPDGKEIINNFLRI
jgi:anthranilate synthase component 2